MMEIDIVFWSSKKQSFMTLSTTKIEFVAFASCCLIKNEFRET